MSSAALMAAQAGTLGAGFSGGGFILPFFLGVIDMLYRDLGILHSWDPVAGASAGSIAAATAIGLASVDDMRWEVDTLSARCRAKNNCFGSLYEEVRRSAQRLTARDAASTMGAHGRAHIAVVHPASSPGGAPWQELVSSFQGREDIIDAIAASCYVPNYAGRGATVRFRGQPVFDGSFGGPGAGYLPCPPEASYCVRVSSMPGGTSMPEVLAELMLGPPSNKVSAASAVLSTFGNADVLGMVASSVLGGGGGGGGGGLGDFVGNLASFMQFQTPGEGEADIFPGRRHALPSGRFEWMSRMAVPGTPEENQAMFDLGRAEALSWAQEAGFPAALARGG